MSRKFYRMIRWPEEPYAEFHPQTWMFECDHLGNVNLAVLAPEAAKAWETCQKLAHGPVIGGGRSAPYDCGVQDVEIYDLEPSL